jgi:hypothetical protein
MAHKAKTNRRGNAERELIFCRCNIEHRNNLCVPAVTATNLHCYQSIIWDIDGTERGEM